MNITAGEIVPGPRSIVIGPDGQQVAQDFIYNLGEANVWVNNVSPHFNDHFAGEPGGVEYICRLAVGPSSPPSSSRLPAQLAVDRLVLAVLLAVLLGLFRFWCSRL
ncbi:hypothetical protein [Gloeobacter kilaueensis]|uniref:hypothetical protein n=1 Tax=Gloeobacter kilaueensis TaxID=1416614 RepID=UPI00118304D5|nr:hypothetical protein [Gloeobacter kilaueensis]